MSWYVRSQNKRNAVYEVACDLRGDFSCTCPDFTFRGHQCKHIKKIKMRLAREEQRNKLFEEEEL